MTSKEIAQRLKLMEEKYVDTFGKKPLNDLNLRIEVAGDCIITIGEPHSWSSLRYIRTESIESALTQAEEFINDLPTQEELNEKEYLKRVSDAIDYAHEHSIEDRYVAPLRDVNKAISDNLLAAPTKD